MQRYDKKLIYKSFSSKKIIFEGVTGFLRTRYAVREEERILCSECIKVNIVHKKGTYPRSIHSTRLRLFAVISITLYVFCLFCIFGTENGLFPAKDSSLRQERRKGRLPISTMCHFERQGLLRNAGIIHLVTENYRHIG